ncbi:MAG: flagellar basal body rod C-terminal domain-containing protein, partial [Actinomycetota bacterium]
ENISSIKSDTQGQVRLQVQQVNLLADQIVSLNQDITQIEASGTPANDLRDQRDQVLKGLAGYVDIQTTEDDIGAVRVTVSGQLLVGSGRSFDLEVNTLTGGEIELSMQGSERPVNLKSGSIAGLISLTDGFFDSVSEDLDLLARNMILEVNRLHSTGIPADGSFTQLLGQNQLTDTNENGDFTDELLSDAGLPFDISAGVLYVNVVDQSTGDTTTRTLDIDPSRTTVGDLLSDLNEVSHLSADVNATGQLQIFADNGFGFDFGARLNDAPDLEGTLGGGNASLGAGLAGPYALSPGGTLDITGTVSSFSVTFDTGDFFSITSATPEEVAAVINSDTNAIANGIEAVVEADRVFLQTRGSGSSESFTINGGTSAAAFGWGAGTNVSGHETSVDIAISGSYTGAANDTFTFVPSADGTIGTTPGLFIEVFNSVGQKVADLDVGEGYQPGTELAVADGVTAKFGFGEISATDNDRISLEVIADSDTSDALVALGLNSLFTGSSAADISVREDIEFDPDLIAASRTGAEGDNQVLLDILGLQSSSITELSDQTFGAFYGATIGDIGFDVASTSSALEVEASLVETLEARREQVSGVNVDEELVNMIQFEQAFAAASQYIQVVNSLNDDLLSIL